MLAQKYWSKWRWSAPPTTPLNLVLTFDPYFSSFFNIKIYHSVFLCENKWSCPFFAIASPFNGPTCWLFFAICNYSTCRITTAIPILASHTFVFSHGSWIGCLCFVSAFWISYEVIQKNCIDDGFLKPCDFTPSRSWRNRLRYLLAEIATKQLPKRTIARILESMLVTFSVIAKIFWLMAIEISWLIKSINFKALWSLIYLCKSYVVIESKSI